LAAALSLGLLMMSCGALTYSVFSFMIVSVYSGRYSFPTLTKSSMLLMTTYR
jgi:hypothetical protein